MFDPVFESSHLKSRLDLRRLALNACSSACSAAYSLWLAIVIVVLAFIPNTAVIGQASGQWAAWLYNASEGSITQVHADGTISGYWVLPLSQAFNTYGRSVVVSPSGRYTAYTAYDSTASTPNIALYVYDRNLSTTSFTYDLSGALATSYEFNPTSLAFDETNDQFAFGYLSETQGWQLVIGDLFAETPVATLNVTHPAMNGFANFVPVVQRYDDGLAVFTAVFYGTELLSQYPSFRWNIAAGSIELDETLVTLTNDIDPLTGQLVIARLDPEQPYTQPEGPVVVANVVEIITANGGRSRLYVEPQGTIRQVKFIENGARILVEAYTFANEQTSLKILNRDGTLSAELVGSLDRITGTPDGFVGMFMSDGSPALARVDTTGTQLTLKTVWGGAAGAPISLVHVVSGG